MFVTSRILALCVLLSSALAYTEKNHVVQLNDANFDDAIAEGGDWLVDFYSPECSHCEALKPEWEDLARRLSVAAALHTDVKKRVLKVASVDCLLNPTVCNEKAQKIEYFPTIKLFSQKSMRAMYPNSQPLKADAILRWLATMFSADESALPAADASAAPAATIADNAAPPVATPPLKPVLVLSLSGAQEWLRSVWIAYPLPVALGIYAAGLLHGLFAGCLYAMREKLD